MNRDEFIEELRAEYLGRKILKRMFILVPLSFVFLLTSNGAIIDIIMWVMFFFADIPKWRAQAIKEYK